jgi:aryl-alcohol dehydrogenase-like predicted oxidoreductase
MVGRIRLSILGAIFLKWIVANPAVTCAIPATGKARHLEDNMQGGIGRLPDAKMRQRMVEVASSL